MIPVYKPYLPPESLRYAQEALASGWVSSQGPYVERAADMLRSMFGYKHVLLTSSGTAAMHLVALTLPQPFTRIVVPNGVYVAAWNMFFREYGIGRFCAVDPDEETWCASYQNFPFKEGDVALVVHNLGSVVDVPALRQLGITIVEDNCEGLFGRYEGRYTGSMSYSSAISFYGNKTVTSGEGGAFVTSDLRVYESATYLANQGATSEKFVSSGLGYNYRMTNLQAALLCGQLAMADEIRKKKAKSRMAYLNALFFLADRVIPQTTQAGTDSANWMFGVRIKGGDAHAAIRFMAARGVECRPTFPSIDRHFHLRHALSWNGDRVAQLLHRECLVLPSYPELSDEDRETAVKALKAYVETL